MLVSFYVFMYVLAWSDTQSCPTLCDPMDYTTQSLEILQPEYWEWVAVPFSRESSQPRDQNQASHIAGRFFTSWATREALEKKKRQEL